MTPYKDTYAAKGSSLLAAIQDGDSAKAKTLHQETKQRYEALVRPEYRMYNQKEEQNGNQS